MNKQLTLRDQTIFQSPTASIASSASVDPESHTVITIDPDLHTVLSKLNSLEDKFDSFSHVQLTAKATLDSLQNSVLEQLPTDLKDQLDDRMNSVEKNLSDKMQESSKDLSDKMQESSKDLPTNQGISWAEVFNQIAPT